ncbi:MAG: thioredoxin domain-containing protein [Microcystaceae cyanobacterium]
MKSIMILLITCFLTLSFSVLPARANSSSPLTQLMTLKTMAKTATDYQIAMNNGKPTLIEFYADWCNSCQKLAPSLEKIHQTYSDEFNLVMMNIDNVKWKPQVQEYKILGVPHLILLNQNQKLIQSWVGVIPKNILEKSIQQLLRYSQKT